MSRRHRIEPDSLQAIRLDFDEMVSRLDGFTTTFKDEPEGVEVLMRTGRNVLLHAALQRAIEHAIGLLPVMGRPRVVEADFAPFDREAAFDAIEAGVAALDAFDPDPEAEPWLGWSGAEHGRAVLGDFFDCEDDGEDFEDGGDGEPALASPENHNSQLRWAVGGQLDVEVQNHV